MEVRHHLKKEKENIMNELNARKQQMENEMDEVIQRRVYGNVSAR